MTEHSTHSTKTNKKGRGVAESMGSGMEMTKRKVAEVISQAKESLKILGALEKETMARARSFVRIPNAAERRRLTNHRILNSLKKLGVATQDEVEALEQKVQKLESALNAKKEGRSSSHPSS